MTNWNSKRHTKESADDAKLKARLASILKKGEFRLWFYNPDSLRYYFLSENGTHGLGFSPTEFALLYNRDDFEALRNKIFEIYDGQVQSATVMVRSNSPSLSNCRYYKIALAIVKTDRRGRPTTLMGVQQDVTREQKKRLEAEQLLMRYHTVFNSAQTDMLYYNKDGVLTDINERACAAFNVTDRQMVLDGSFLLQNNPMYNQIPLEQMENTRATTIVDFRDYQADVYRLDEFKLKGKMYYESAINPIRNERGELEGVYMAGRDISEMVESFHRQQEGSKRLLQANKDIQQYIDDINYALHVSDVSLVNYYPKRYTFEISSDVNAQHRRFSQLRCIRMATPRFRRVVSSALNRMDHLTPHSIVQAIETEFRDKQGRQIWLLFNMVPMTDAEGNVERYFGMYRNITDQVETERRLAVETQKAQETELLKQAFLTNMSYEIRTPLNTVVGFAELFNTDHDEADEPFFVEQIKNSTNSLLVLVDDVLFLSRLDAHMEEYKTADVDFELIFQTYCQLGMTTVRPEVKTVVVHPYNSLIIDVDVEHLGMVIQRLLTFSCQMTLQGSVTASYEYRRGELTIIIEDTGGGIHPDVLPHVFERFARDEHGKMCGTGLDLPIIQSLVQQMGGSVDMQSELGKGTTVWVFIPCTAKLVEKKRD